MVTKPRKIGPKWPGPKVFHQKNAKMCFSPRGSFLSFEGGILLSISLGLAVRIFWSDLEKFPKSASGKIWGATFWVGDLFGVKNVPKKRGFVEEWFCDGFYGESILSK